MTGHFIHKNEAVKLLGITESELMTLVSNGRLQGFNQNRQPVKHYGRYHAGQVEEERLPGAVLSMRVSYFDRGDILAFADQSKMDIQSQFPNLNLPLLKSYAKRWASELPEVTSIKLYPYQSHLAKWFDRKSSVKYAIVFDGDTKKLWPPVTDDSGEYPQFIDARFADVYRLKPDRNYWNDWYFATSDLVDNNEFSPVMVNEAHVDLWPEAPAAEETSKEEKPTMPVDEFVRESIENKVPKETIALKLRDVYGMTYLQIARLLELDKGYGENQVDTIKKMGERLYKKAKKKQSGQPGQSGHFS